MTPQGSLAESPDGGVPTPILQIWDRMSPRQTQLPNSVTLVAADIQKWYQGGASLLYPISKTHFSLSLHPLYSSSMHQIYRWYRTWVRASPSIFLPVSSHNIVAGQCGSTCWFTHLRTRVWYAWAAKAPPSSPAPFQIMGELFPPPALDLARPSGSHGLLMAGMLPAPGVLFSTTTYLL